MGRSQHVNVVARLGPPQKAKTILSWTLTSHYFGPQGEVMHGGFTALNHTMSRTPPPTVCGDRSQVSNQCVDMSLGAKIHITPTDRGYDQGRRVRRNGRATGSRPKIKRGKFPRKNGLSFLSLVTTFTCWDRPTVFVVRSAQPIPRVSRAPECASSIFGNTTALPTQINSFLCMRDSSHHHASTMPTMCPFDQRYCLSVERATFCFSTPSSESA